MPTSCEESRASFVNTHKVVEGSASFGTAKLYALIGLQQKFSLPTAVFSISLRGEYDNSAKIILLNCVEAVFARPPEVLCKVNPTQGISRKTALKPTSFATSFQSWF